MIELAISGSRIKGDFPGSRIMNEIFIGREKELGQAEKLIKSSSGCCRYILIEGQAGIGKTAFGNKILRMARDAGYLILRGSFHEGTSHSALSPWRQILEKARLFSKSSNLLETDDFLTKHSPLFHALHEPWFEVEELRIHSEEERKYQFFSWAAEFLTELSARKPMIIFIEDLHLSDSLSLHLLEYLSDVLEYSDIIFSFTCRPQTGSAGTVVESINEQLRFHDQCAPIALDALSREEIGSYIQRASREGMSLDTVLQWTDGVPLRVMLYLEHNLSPDKAMKSDLAVYAAYWDYLKGRFGPDAQTSLIRLALIGNAFHKEEALSIFDSVSKEQGNRNFDECIRYGILINREDFLCFFHDEFRLFLIGTLISREKEEIIAECAALLDQHYRNENERKIYLLAGLYNSAESQEMDGNAVSYNLQAAAAMEERGSHEDASEYYGKALDRGQTLLNDEKIRDIKVKLAINSTYCIKVEVAIPLIMELCDYYRGQNNVDRLAEILELPIEYFVGIDFTGMYEFLLERMEPDDPRTSLILSRFSLMLSSWDINPKRATLEAEKALVSANLSEDELPKYLALVHLAHLKLKLGEIEAGSKLLDRAFALSISLIKLRHHVVRADEMFMRGEMKKSRNSLEEASLKLKLRNDPYMTWMHTYHRQRHALYIGDWGKVLSITHENPGMTPVQIPHVLTWLFIGELKKADEYLDQILHFAAPETPEYRMRGSVVIAWVGGARSILAGPSIHMSEIEEAINYVLSYELSPERFVVEACISAGWISRWRFSSDECSGMYEKLCSYDGKWPEEEKYSIENAKALLCLKMGSPGYARKHFRKALDWCDHFEELPWRAWISFELAALLSPDTEQEQLFANAGTIAHDLGMTPLLRKLEAREGTASRLSTVEDSLLTSRETEVAAFLAKGYTDKEIGGLLHISAHTVANHLRNIYRKLDVSNRGEAVHFVLSEGIVEL